MYRVANKMNSNTSSLRAEPTCEYVHEQLEICGYAAKNAMELHIINAMRSFWWFDQDGGLHNSTSSDQDCTVIADAYDFKELESNEHE